MIIALAGRRIDSPDAEKPRFPLKNVEQVHTRIRAFFKERAATAMVSSAACGADLIALSEAGSLGIRRRVILPFDRSRFRKTSVTDRPGDWGPLYDQTLDAVEAAGDLIVLPIVSDDAAYSAATRAIIGEAVELSKAIHKSAVAVLIWDGASRGDRDQTEKFGAEARKRGLPVKELSTI
jgi:hypothetical protein